MRRGPSRGINVQEGALFESVGSDKEDSFNFFTQQLCSVE
jgi:hypothetical protein